MLFWTISNKSVIHFCLICLFSAPLHPFSPVKQTQCCSVWLPVSAAWNRCSVCTLRWQRHSYDYNLCIWLWIRRPPNHSTNVTGRLAATSLTPLYTQIITAVIWASSNIMHSKCWRAAALTDWRQWCKRLTVSRVFVCMNSAACSSPVFEDGGLRLH